MTKDRQKLLDHYRTYGTSCGGVTAFLMELQKIEAPKKSEKKSRKRVTKNRDMLYNVTTIENNKTKEDIIMSDKQSTTYRLETAKRLFVINYFGGNKYDIVSGSKTGKCTMEKREVVDGEAGRTPEQETLFRIAKQLNARLKQGYEEAKGKENKNYGSVADLNETLEKIKISVVDVKKVQKALEKAEAKLAKIKEKYDEAVAEKETWETEMKKLQDILG